MNTKRYILLFAVAFFAIANNLFAAQEGGTELSVEKKTEKKKKNWGKLSGSFETNTIYYVKDNETGAKVPADNYGSNNYLKLDYTYGKFTAGIQAEYYPQVLQGYEEALKGFGLTGKYVEWNDKNFSITLGDYYEQFGSGLLFRSWEDRTLGLNNSIGGARIKFNIKDYVSAKIIYGFPRDYMNYYSKTQIFGLDLSVNLSNIFKMNPNHSLTIEGSALERLENSIPSDYKVLNLGLKKGNFSYSARLNYQYKNFSVKGEYVDKGEDLYLSPKTSNFELKSGNAQLVEANYSSGGLAISGMFRRLENMQNQIYRTTSTALPANTLNYIPAMVPQHIYMLAVLNPYNPYVQGEMGGQLDVFYNFKKGSVIGGKRGLKVHGNISYFNALGSALHVDGNKFLYRDITFDVDKTWNSKWKTIFFMSIQEYSPSHGESALTEAQNVFVADVTYKIKPKISLRAELQYLYSEELKKDWMAALLELNFAPKWSVFVSDMYNHGDTKLHYYSAGASFTYSGLRAAITYGRNREGMVCSGGVCRYQPAYTGGNLSLTYLF